MGISSKFIIDLDSLSTCTCTGNWRQVIRRVHKNLPRAFPGALQLKVDFGLVPSVQLFECHSFPPRDSTRRLKETQNPTYFWTDRGGSRSLIEIDARNVIGGFYLAQSLHFFRLSRLASFKMAGRHSIVEYFGDSGGHRCGYCKSSSTNQSHGK